MSENRHKLLDMELEHQRMTIKMFNIVGWTLIIISVPLLIVPPIGVPGIGLGLAARYMSKRFGKMVDLADAVNREELPPRRLPSGNA